MSDVIDQAVAALNQKLGAGAFDGTAKFVIDGMSRNINDEIHHWESDGLPAEAIWSPR